MNEEELNMPKALLRNICFLLIIKVPLKCWRQSQTTVGLGIWVKLDYTGNSDITVTVSGWRWTSCPFWPQHGMLEGNWPSSLTTQSIRQLNWRAGWENFHSPSACTSPETQPGKWCLKTSCQATLVCPNTRKWKKEDQGQWIWLKHQGQ